MISVSTQILILFIHLFSFLHFRENGSINGSGIQPILCGVFVDDISMYVYVIWHVYVHDVCVRCGGTCGVSMSLWSNNVIAKMEWKQKNCLCT